MGDNARLLGHFLSTTGPLGQAVEKAGKSAVSTQGRTSEYIVCAGSADNANGRPALSFFGVRSGASWQDCARADRALEYSSGEG